MKDLFLFTFSAVVTDKQGIDVEFNKKGGRWATFIHKRQILSDNLINKVVIVELS